MIEMPSDKLLHQIMYFQLQSHNDGDICTPAIIHLWFINLTINSPSADVDKS